MNDLREPVPLEVYEAGVYLHGTKADLAVGVQEVLTDMLAVKLKSYFSEGVLNQVVAARAMGARDILRYQSMNSRATFNRYALSTNPAKQNA